MQAKRASPVPSLTVTVDEYKQARRAFGGGFTHTDPFHADVDCWCFVGKDFTSAYPAECVLSDEFPMAPGEEVEVITPEIFEKSCKLYFCMFDIIFEGLEATFLYDNYNCNQSSCVEFTSFCNIILILTRKSKSYL